MTISTEKEASLRFLALHFGIWGYVEIVALDKKKEKVQDFKELGTIYSK